MTVQNDTTPLRYRDSHRWMKEVPPFLLSSFCLETRLHLPKFPVNLWLHSLLQTFKDIFFKDNWPFLTDLGRRLQYSKHFFLVNYLLQSSLYLDKLQDHASMSHWSSFRTIVLLDKLDEKPLHKWQTVHHNSSSYPAQCTKKEISMSHQLG